MASHSSETAAASQHRHHKAGLACQEKVEKDLVEVEVPLLSPGSAGDREWHLWEMQLGAARWELCLEAKGWAVPSAALVWEGVSSAQGCPRTSEPWQGQLQPEVNKTAQCRHSRRSPQPALLCATVPCEHLGCPCVPVRALAQPREQENKPCPSCRLQPSPGSSGFPPPQTSAGAKSNLGTVQGVCWVPGDGPAGNAISLCHPSCLEGFREPGAGV